MSDSYLLYLLNLRYPQEPRFHTLLGAYFLSQNDAMIKVATYSESFRASKRIKDPEWNVLVRKVCSNLQESTSSAAVHRDYLNFLLSEVSCCL